MLGKLGRELDRLDAATTSEDAADHYANASITAWHLTDWTWSAIKQSEQLYDRVSSDLGLSRKMPDFKRWLREQGCPELRYCQIISNSLKHFAYDSKPDDPDFSDQQGPMEGLWVNELGQTGSWINEAGELGYFSVGDDSQWWITEGDRKYLVTDLLKITLKFWCDFLDRYAIQ